MNKLICLNLITFTSFFYSNCMDQKHAQKRKSPRPPIMEIIRPTPVLNENLISSNAMKHFISACCIINDYQRYKTLCKIFVSERYKVKGHQDEKVFKAVQEELKKFKPQYGDFIFKAHPYNFNK